MRFYCRGIGTGQLILEVCYFEWRCLFFKYISSVLFAFTSWPMPPATCSGLCSRDSTWASVFERSVRLSAQSSSVIVFVGYPLLVFLYVKPFNFI